MIYFFVRGGIPHVYGWYQSAIDGASSHPVGKPNLSVFGIDTEELTPSIDLVELVTRNSKIRNGKVCYTNSTKLLEAGFEYERAPDPDYGDMHFHILFSVDFKPPAIELFISCLEGPIINPHQWKGL